MPREKNSVNLAVEAPVALPVTKFSLCDSSISAPDSSMSSTRASASSIPSEVKLKTPDVVPNPFSTKELKDAFSS